MLTMLCAMTIFQPGLARSYAPCKLLVKLKDTAITESSGIAASIRNPREFWTHNDSGDTARVFRCDRSGRTLATYRFEGLKAVDWEDCATAVVQRIGYLYIGDIGDNVAIRKSIQIVRLPEPKGADGFIHDYETFSVTYEDGPRNCETLMVHPATGDIYLVQKVNRGKSRVYVVRSPKPNSKAVAKYVGSIDIGSIIPGSQMTTGGDISADGKWAIVRTYTAAFEFKIPAKADDWVKSPPARVDLRSEGQGEAIGYLRDGSGFLTTSEGSPCEVSMSLLASRR